MTITLANQNAIWDTTFTDGNWPCFLTADKVLCALSTTSSTYISVINFSGGAFTDRTNNFIEGNVMDSHILKRISDTTAAWVFSRSGGSVRYQGITTSGATGISLTGSELTIGSTNDQFYGLAVLSSSLLFVLYGAFSIRGAVIDISTLSSPSIVYDAEIAANPQDDPMLVRIGPDSVIAAWIYNNGNAPGGGTDAEIPDGAIYGYPLTSITASGWTAGTRVRLFQDVEVSQANSVQYNYSITNSSSKYLRTTPGTSFTSGNPPRITYTIQTGKPELKGYYTIRFWENGQIVQVGTSTVCRLNGRYTDGTGNICPEVGIIVDFSDGTQYDSFAAANTITPSSSGSNSNFDITIPSSHSGKYINRLYMGCRSQSGCASAVGTTGDFYFVSVEVVSGATVTKTLRADDFWVMRGFEPVDGTGIFVAVGTVVGDDFGTFDEDFRRYIQPVQISSGISAGTAYQCEDAIMDDTAGFGIGAAIGQVDSTRYVWIYSGTSSGVTITRWLPFTLSSGEITLDYSNIQTADVTFEDPDNTGHFLYNASGAFAVYVTPDRDSSPSVDYLYIYADVAESLGSHIWISSDGSVNWTNIGDPSWASDVVGAVVVIPGSDGDEIYATVGTSLWYTDDQGATSWTNLVSIGYESDTMIYLPNGGLVYAAAGNAPALFVANRSSGGNRASIIYDLDGTPTIAHLNTSKSTSGGATASGSTGG